MSNFNTLLNDIVNQKSNVIVTGNNKIASNDVYEYLVDLAKEKKKDDYCAMDMYDSFNGTQGGFVGLFDKMNKEKKSICSICLNEVKELKDFIDNQGADEMDDELYLIDIHEIALHEDIYIKIYKMFNGALRQIDMRGNVLVS